MGALCCLNPLRGVVLATRYKKPLLLGLSALVLGFCVLGWPRSQPTDFTCTDPSITIYKASSELELRCGEAVRYSAPATFGANPQGKKERQGDERTPEGEYTVAYKKQNFLRYRFLGLSYPNRSDRENARRHHISDPGNGIGIHGGPAPLAVFARAWVRAAKLTGFSRFWGPTDGCILVPNEDADLLFRVIPEGTPVRILEGARTYQ